MVKGILFDKDGTLIDFFELWLGAAKWAIPRMMEENSLSEDLENYILETIGVKKGYVDPAGALAYKPYSDIAEDICIALNRKGIQIEKQQIREQLERLFSEYAQSDKAVYKETANLQRLMKELKARQIKIGLATVDTITSAESCLRKLNIIEYFDYIGADDGEKKPKPEKDMFQEFEKQYHLHSDEIMIVGDTFNDIVFAERCGGIPVAVLSGVSSKQDFKEYPDYILRSVGEIPTLLNTIEKAEALQNKKVEQ